MDQELQNRNLFIPYVNTLLNTSIKKKRGFVSMDVKFPRILDEKTYKGLTPQDQEDYVEGKIKQIVTINEHGISVPDIEKNTPFTRPTIIKHLERMVAIRESYKIRWGKMSIYYPNGKIVHPESRLDEMSPQGTRYRATFLNNQFGRFVYVEDMNPKGVSGGSLLINIEDLDFYVEFINKVGNIDEKVRYL